MDPDGFALRPHPSPVPAARRDELMATPVFGRVFTDHMVTIAWNVERGWYDPAVVPYAPLSIDPAAAVLHHGATVFEGLKVFRGPDGAVSAFRPDLNAARFRTSARRLAMPELPDATFLAALRALLRVDHPWVPPAGGEGALYVRPLLVATTPSLRPEPAPDHLFVLLAGPVGPYFPGGAAPVRAWLSRDQVRAFPGGTGAAKCGANYAASLAGQARAAAHGCDQVVWLDATHRRWVEEMGVMNLFFVFDDGRGGHEVVTPELNGSFLAGVTRSSLLTLAAESGAAVSERPIAADEWRERAVDGSLREVFASGTAAVVTPVGTVVDERGEFPIADAAPGPLTLALRETLTGIQRGARPDPHRWLAPLR